MRQAKELPGFYYDPHKNRYFPLKPSIPGASSSSSSSSSSSAAPRSLNKPRQAVAPNNVCRTSSQLKTSRLLQVRELHGNAIPFGKGKCNFIEEFRKIQASQPVVWKYQGTERMGDGAIDQIRIDMLTPQGQTEKDVLITGGMNGSLSLFELGEVGQHFDHGIKCIPERVWPAIEETAANCVKSPGNIWTNVGAPLQMPSSISCIKLLEAHSPSTIDNGFNMQHALITTLGSETSGGSVSILGFVEPIDFYSSTPIRQMMREIASLHCTIWTAACSPNASQAVIGTNLGAALVNVERGTTSWVCRSKSDVLAQCFDQSGNVVLCGLRNGAIVTVDVREKQEQFSARLSRHRIPHLPLSSHSRNSSRQWFELKGNISPSCTIYMPSSICCLVSLKSYDQYFLANSMDGSIKLYDHRMAKRGAVQSYEGHVNSHTRIQLGVDPSERFIMAGGEDCKLRLWSIRSGELLFEEKFSDSVPSTISWERTERLVRIQDGGKSNEESRTWWDGNWGSWFGSRKGLFYMNW